MNAPSLSDQAAERVQGLARSLALTMTTFITDHKSGQAGRDKQAALAWRQYMELADAWRRFDAALSVSGEPLPKQPDEPEPEGRT